MVIKRAISKQVASSLFNLWTRICFEELDTLLPFPDSISNKVHNHAQM